MQLLNPGWRKTIAGLMGLALLSQTGLADDTSRRTPLVQAVAGCRDSVVNLRGKKIAAVEPGDAGTEESQMVNGMGTGVVIDSRGYLLTNYHVVQDIQSIQVTTRDHQQCWATLVAHDPVTDLAVIKINPDRPLPRIRLGHSANLMLAETVAAVGNAYGYEHSVTTGIVSHLDRTVQVNDHQIYENLIQTDAAINPGNSGGPLLNLDGEMIGVNVAVRVGAQGIAFAIPVDKAIEVAADLIAQHAARSIRHGLRVETRFRGELPEVVVVAVEPGSPAASAGIRTGDVVVSAEHQPVSRAIDYYRSMLDRTPGNSVPLVVRSVANGADSAVSLTLMAAVSETAARTNTSPEELAWQALGLRLVEVSEGQMRGLSPDYQRGLRITEIMPGAPAIAEGVQVGDILVAMHGWKTENLDNLGYVLDLPEIRNRDEFRFYILRRNECFLGKMKTRASLTPMRQASIETGQR